MSRKGKHLGHVGGPEVPQRKPVPPVVYDELLTLPSILCQRCFGCAKVAVLHLFGTTKRIPFKQLLFPLELMRCGEPPWIGRGNAATHHERWSQKSDLRKFPR
jgi:hypothetical protein